MNNKILSLFGLLLCLGLVACGGGGASTNSSSEPPVKVVPTVGGGNVHPPTSGNFDANRANNALPNDVLQEVSYFSGGGPVGCENEQYDIPRIDSAQTSQGELMEDIHVLTCGWKINESVKVTIDFPNGQTLSSQELALDDNSGSTGFVLGSLTPTLDDPTGKYRFIFQSNTTTLEWSMTVSQPKGARRRWISDSELFLYNFRPNEKVRLFAYDSSNPGTLRFVAWQEYQVGSTGQLKITVSNKKNLFRYLIVGSQSGFLSDDYTALTDRNSIVR